MFKRITDLFKGKKSEPGFTEISLADLPAWLQTEEDACTSKRTSDINESRDAIDTARKEILKLLVDFGAEDSDEPRHHKVEQVNRVNLPQFKKKVETALDVTFSDEDEAYYVQVAELIDGCFKAYRGPGRYLHHLYGTEVKLFRQFMDQIGKELNVLTEIIKVSRIRIGRIVAVRNALEQFESAEKELQTTLMSKEDLEKKKVVILEQQDLLVDEKEKTITSQHFLEFLGKKEDLDKESAKVSELFETLDALIRTALPVWRKAHRIVQDQHSREKEKILDHLIQLAMLQKFGEDEFPILFSKSTNVIFSFLTDGQITLKNSFEKALFVSAEEYHDQVTEALNSWKQTEAAWLQDRDELGFHPAGTVLATLETRIEELEREVRHLDEEAGKIDGRIHHLEREKKEASSVVAEEMKELSGGTLMAEGFTLTEEAA